MQVLSFYLLRKVSVVGGWWCSEIIASALLLFEYFLESSKNIETRIDHENKQEREQKEEQEPSLTILKED